MKKRLVVMASGSGSDMQSIMDAIDRGEIDGEIVLVIVSKHGAYAAERAKQHGIKTVEICLRDYPGKSEFFDANLAAIDEARPDGIILAGYLSILDRRITEKYANRIINIHPALIPSFCGDGFYGKRVHQAVIDYGAKISGATIHFVDEHADHGPIIMQETVPVYFEDTADTLAARVLELEHKILPKAVGLFCADRLHVIGRAVKIDEQEERK